MKKVICLLLVVIALVSLVACGNNDTTNDDTSKETKPQASSVPTESETVPSKTDDKNESYDSWAKVTGSEIFVNYKSGRRKDAKSCSIVFHNDNNDLTFLAYNNGTSFSGNAKEAFDAIDTVSLFNDIGAYCEANFMSTGVDYKIEKKSENNVTVNTLSASKFSGIAKDANGIECYVYGYSFVFEDTPCVLAGMVVNKTQDSESKTAIEHEVDSMIQTIRNEK